MTDETLVHYKFGILAATAFYGSTLERSLGRGVATRLQKADALARALPESERAVVERAFARFKDLQDFLLSIHGAAQ